LAPEMNFVSKFCNKQKIANNQMNIDFQKYLLTKEKGLDLIIPKINIPENWIKT